MKPVSGHPFLKKVLPVSKLGLSLFLRFKDSFFCFSVFVAYWASLVAQMVKSPPGKSPGGGNSSPLQYSSLGKPMDRGAWWPAVHGVTLIVIRK